MANFPPLKNYIIYCLDHFIAQYPMSPPFLDIGCGTGDVSRHVLSKAWYGKAIDTSDIAIVQARNNLSAFGNVVIEKKCLFEETGTFKTIFLIDVLEHIENDTAALEKVSSLLSLDGYTLIVVPSNPREWRWDDDFYGHYRRYTTEDIKNKLIHARLEPLALFDFTYPTFWMMRRIYTWLKRVPKNIEEDKTIRTNISTSVNAWECRGISSLLSRGVFIWNILYKLQFAYFRDKVEKGYEIMILCKKKV